MNDRIIAGVDEAGRGPVIGPLVIAGVSINEEDIPELVSNGLTDSKLVSKKKRQELFDLITNKAIEKHLIIVKASDIDYQMSCSVNLNQIEKNAMAEILGSLTKWSKAYVDACDVNAKRFEKELRESVKREMIIAEHSADLEYPVVSAASILAKVTRDKIIDNLHKEFDTDFGSGYPSDPKTCEFIRNYYRENKKLPPIVRSCWATTKKIIEEVQQQKLEEFFGTKENKI